MRNIASKIMVSLACAIIVLHAVVPHHHHDCADGMGLVFETELCCHCDEACPEHAVGLTYDYACGHSHHGHQSNHPFDICILQEMLSHLTLVNSDDKYYFTALIKAEAQMFFQYCLPTVQSDIIQPDLGTLFCWPAAAVPSVAVPYCGTASLRAPPVCA